MRLALAAFLAWISAVLWSQTPPALPRPDPTGEYLITKWETEDGLPENSATAMVQTPDGYLWFGTFNGLVRFDGVKFTVFNPANSPGLPDPGIVNLHLDRRGRLWASTLRGVAMREEGKWRAFQAAEGWQGNYARTFTERANGDLLVTTFDGKVLEFTGDRFRALPPPPGNNASGYLGGVDEKGAWWVAQNKFIGRWDEKTWVEMVKPPAPGQLAPAETVGFGSARDGGLWLLIGPELRKYKDGVEVARREMPRSRSGFWSLYEDSRANIWIATYNGGVSRISPTGEIKKWKSASGLPYDNVRFVFEDREDNVWIGTSGGGLLRYRSRRFQSFGPEEGLADRVVKSVWPVPGGNVWIGTYGSGLFRLRDGKVTRASFTNAFVLSVLEDRAGRTWVGTYGASLWQYSSSGLRSLARDESGCGRDASALFEDSRGRVWIGHSEGVTVFDGNRFRSYGREQGVPPDEVRALAEDQDGRIWISQYGSVFRLEGDRFTQIFHHGRPIQNILCFKTEKDGTIWMGSRTDGLLLWRQGTLVPVGARAGLPVSSVHGILEDDTGYFWMTSNKGIARASRKDLLGAAEGRGARVTCQLFDLADGLPSVECPAGQQPACARDAAGRFWFATLKGVAMIDPRQLRINSKPPPIVIERAGYVDRHGDHQDAPWRAGERLILPPGTLELGVYFAALSQTAPEKIRFAYKLDEQNDWIDAGTRRSLVFPVVVPGEMRIKIKAANNDGIWNERGAELAVVVLPFYWQTLWFRTLAFSGALGGIGLAIWQVTSQRARRLMEKMESEAFLRLSQRVGHVGSWEWDIASGRVKWSEEMCRLHGLSPAEFDGAIATAASFFHPDDAPRFAEGVRRLLATGEFTSMEYRIRARDGVDRHLWAHGEVVLGAAGKPQSCFGTVVDITGRKSMEDALRISESRFRALVEGTDVILWEFDDRNQQSKYVSPQAARLGFSLNDWLRPNFWAEHVHPGDREQVDYSLAEIQAGRSYRHQYRFATVGGDYIWIDDRVSIETRPDGSRVIRGVMHDITDQMHVEDRLRQSEEKYRMLVENSTDLVAEVSKDGRFLYLSSNFKTQLGYEPGDLLDQPVLAFVHPDESLEVAGKLSLPQASSVCRFRHRDGSWRWLDSSGRTFYNPAKEQRRVIVARDITEKRLAEEQRARLENQLRHTQKMESIGKLAGGIAHDFNNILAAMIAYTHMARMETGGQPAVQESLDQVLKAGDRAKDLVQQILAFSRHRKLEKQPVNLQPVVREVLELLRSSLPATIEISHAVHASAGTVLADATQIHQVLVNLCTNAGHAMREKPGRMEVRLEPCLVDEALAHELPELRPGPHARLTVADNGHGMDEPTLKLIFEPFFTTKGPGEGSGLGLSVVLGIVKDHEGAIQVSSRPGQGTVFHLYFPALGRAPAEHSAPGARMPRGRGQQILFVDDEAPLCRLAEMILRRLGYRITVVTDPLAALPLVSECDLLVSDLAMPGMTGIDLARAALLRNPRLPILLSTGFSGDWTEEKLKIIGIQALLPKPYAPAELAQAVERLLTGAEAGSKAPG